VRTQCGPADTQPIYMYVCCVCGNAWVPWERKEETATGSALEASRVDQVHHGRGAGPTRVRYSNNTTTLHLPMPAFIGVAGVAVAAGKHYDDLQHSTTNKSPSTVLFSRRVRQQRQDVNGMPRALRGTTPFAAAAGAGWRQQQTTSNDTQPCDTRPSSGWHRGDLAAFSRCVRQRRQGAHALASEGTACIAAAANVEPQRHLSTPTNIPTFDTSRHGGLPCLHRCEVACVCTVCGSDRHFAHDCFIAHGVPTRVKMRVDKVVELVRLHGLYVQGAFDWRTTPTSLAWMLCLRVWCAMAANLGPDPYQGEGGGGQANGCGCVVCCPANPHDECDPGLMVNPHDECDRDGMHGEGGGPG